MEAKIIIKVSVGRDLELTQYDEGKVSLSLYSDCEEDGRRCESTFTCDRLELIKALQKLPKVHKLINEFNEDEQNHE